MTTKKHAPRMRTSAAILLGGALLQGTASAQESTDIVVAAEPPLPVTGVWDADIPESALEADCFNQFADRGSGRVSERTDVYEREGGRRWIAFEQDCAIENRGQLNKPMYKPEYWELIRLLDYNANVGGEWSEYADPAWQNISEGVPRLGAPDKILYNEDPVRGPELTFLWADMNQYKMIPADCQLDDESLAYDQTVLGYGYACWEDDSLVVTSRGFSNVTWLHWTGYIHSNEMEVIETFTPNQDGSAMLYEVEVRDPVMLLEPWVMDPDIMERNTNPEAVMLQDVPYIEHSLGVLALPRNRG